MPPQITVIGIEGMPEARPGDDLADQILAAARAQGIRQLWTGTCW